MSLSAGAIVILDQKVYWDAPVRPSVRLSPILDVNRICMAAKSLRDKKFLKQKLFSKKSKNTKEAKFIYKPVKNEYWLIV